MPQRIRQQAFSDETTTLKDMPCRASSLGTDDDVVNGWWWWCV